jgi:hypothetical protein
MIEHINTKTSNLSSVSGFIICYEQASVNTTLNVKLLNLSTFVPKHSKISALGYRNGCNFDVLELFVLLHTHLGNAMVSIAPHVWLDGFLVTGYDVLPVSFPELTEVELGHFT